MSTANEITRLGNAKSAIAAATAESDNTRPITSEAVYALVGDIGSVLDSL